MMREENFEVQYEYIHSEDNQQKLDRVFDMIFSKAVQRTTTVDAQSQKSGEESRIPALDKQV